MTNKQLINARWRYSDRLLKEYSKTFKGIFDEIKDELIDLFKQFNLKQEDLNKTLSSSDKRKFERDKREWKRSGVNTPYFDFLLTTTTKLTYSNILKIYVLAIYLMHNSKVKRESHGLLCKVANDIYSQACEDLKQKKERDLTWANIRDWAIVMTINVPFDDYLLVLDQTASEESSRLMINTINQDLVLTHKNLSKLIEKQLGRIISINKEKRSGLLENISRQVGNAAYVRPFSNQVVRFIAEMDDRTTRMCRSLNDQLFNTIDRNIFYRYSDEAQSYIRYDIMGLVEGINLPPIMDHFHWCRSVLVYDTDVTSNIFRMRKELYPKLGEVDPRTMDRLDDLLQRIDRIKNKQGFKKDFEIDPYITVDGKKYPIDGRNVVLDPSEEEILYAFKLQNEYDKQVKLRPRMRGKGAVRVSDYYINDIPFDLKEFTGTNQRTIARKIKASRLQAQNFIVKVKEGSRSAMEAINDINKLKLNNPWIESIWLFGEKDNLIKIWE